MLRYKTEIAWFSRLVRHPARKRSGLFLQPQRPHRADRTVAKYCNFT